LRGKRCATSPPEQIEVPLMTYRSKATPSRRAATTMICFAILLVFLCMKEEEFSRLNTSKPATSQEGIVTGGNLSGLMKRKSKGSEHVRQ